MKTYAYFPGCSLEKMAVTYDMSARACARALGIELRELEDWNCCGATAYFNIDQVMSYLLCSRNLALAEANGLDFVTPCSGCYKNMYFTNATLSTKKDLVEHIARALKADGLKFTGKVKVFHLIEVFIEEVGLEKIRELVVRPLRGLRVAPYYGCQLLRPRKASEDVEQPRFFENLIKVIGATAVEYPFKLRCCGGSLVVTKREAALTMIRDLLQNASDSGADIIATICPLCQNTLECYQAQVNRVFKTRFRMPIVYFTQLLGLALGISERQLGLGKELVSPLPVLQKSRSVALPAENKTARV